MSNPQDRGSHCKGLHMPPGCICVQWSIHTPVHPVWTKGRVDSNSHKDFTDFSVMDTGDVTRKKRIYFDQFNHKLASMCFLKDAESLSCPPIRRSSSHQQPCCPYFQIRSVRDHIFRLQSNRPGSSHHHFWAGEFPPHCPASCVHFLHLARRTL